MQRSGTPKTRTQISDEAVKARTGRNWKEWFAILDAAGARKMNHSAIATYLYDKRKLSGWWAQMVAVGYEQERGLRGKYQGPSGFRVSSSKVISVPLRHVYAAWHNDRSRARWLKDKGLVVRKSTPNKSMRITWTDGTTSLEVGFFSRGPGKSQVAVQHSKLANAAAAERMKTFWAEKLEGLKHALEV